MNTKSLETMTKTAKVSFLTSTVAAMQTIVASLPEGGAKNDAALELAAHQYFLTAAKQFN